MREHYPMGKRLPALERNILKFRTFEMVLVLFQVEELKTFVLGIVRAIQRRPQATHPTKVSQRQAWTFLVNDEIISQAEHEDIRQIIDYRNTIAHELYQLTCDLSREPLAKDHSEFAETKYNYGLLAKLKLYRSKISHVIAEKYYILSPSFQSAVFESTEKTYRQELRRLSKTITKQHEVRTNEIEKLQAEIARACELLGDVDAFRPLDVARNGTLTERGVEVCYRLFDNDVSTLATACLMRLSHRATCQRYKTWKKAGGKSRRRFAIPEDMKRP